MCILYAYSSYFYIVLVHVVSIIFCSKYTMSSQMQHINIHSLQEVPYLYLFCGYCCGLNVLYCKVLHII